MSESNSARAGTRTKKPARDADDAALLDRYSWDSLRLLLCLDEAGSFRSGATVGGVSLNTMRSKIERLERQFGGPLIIRSVEGVRMNQDGRELVSIIREMRDLTTTTRRVADAKIARPHEVVRVTVTEGLGTYWLVPKIVDFIEKHPDLRIDLTCNMSAPDVLFRDVDISVQLKRPETTDLVADRVGTLHVMPFASERYLRRFGMPKSAADLPDHRLVWQVADTLPVDVLHDFVDRPTADAIIALRTNTSSAHYLAVAEGAGIGMLPTYTRALSSKTRPIDMGIRLAHDIFVVHRRDADLTGPTRVAIQWLRSTFDPSRNPWFAREFVHPDDFSRRAEDNVVVPLFGDIDRS